MSQQRNTTVFDIGSYSGRAKNSGKAFSARFVHDWTVRDGKLVRLQQCADTIQLARALNTEKERGNV